MALLDALHAPGGDPEARNRVLRALVAAAQTGVDETTQVLLLLALWPGLDAVHGRLLGVWRDDRDDLAGDILGHVAVAIRTLDLDRVHRIAAALVRGVERDLRRWRMAEDKHRHTDGGDVLDRLAMPTETSTGVLDRDLDHLLGPDAGLVIDIAVHGTPQREACAARGLPYEAGRKRYRRALEKIRKVA